jgi:Ca-activated chloride channel homolog
MSDQPLLNVSIQATRQQLGAIDAPQVMYLLLNIQAPDSERFERMPLNLALVIDRSTSMRDERLNQVKAAAGLLIDQLTSKDNIALITFSDRAEVVSPAAPPNNIGALRAALRGITANGATEILQGLQAAANELRKNNSSDKINQLILFTDGHTYGDAADCIALSEKLALEHIDVSAFGIGHEWNDQFLDQLVAPSGGQSAYIERPTQIIRNLQGRIHGLEARYAQNLSLSARFAAGVELRAAFKIAPFTQPLAVTPHTIILGALEKHTPLTILLEFVIQPQLPGRSLHIPLNISGDIPSHQAQNQVFRHEYRLPIVMEETPLDPPAALVAAVRAYNFYHMNERVWEDVEAGQVDTAVTRLRRLTTRLLEAGHSDLAEQAYAETELLSRMGTLSLEGRKRLKYGTRSLMAKTTKIEPYDKMS